MSLVHRLNRGTRIGGHNTHFPSCFYFGDTKYAQSPAILLDIKSPATASPPNESLVTINDAGDLWVKGQLYDHAFQSTITLDPAKEYWTLRDAILRYTNASAQVVFSLSAAGRSGGE